MRKFKEYVTEDLNLAKKEPSSAAAKEAKTLNLQYVSFGRYADPKTGQVTHIVKNGHLVPFNKAVKTNSYKETNTDDWGNFTKEMKPQKEEHHANLSKLYDGTKYSGEELDAIKNWTDVDFFHITPALNKLPTGIPAEEIQPESPTVDIGPTVAALDKAMGRIKTDTPMIVYTALSGSYNVDDIQPGKTFEFKSFRSTTLDLAQALRMNKDSKGNSLIIQIRIDKGSPGIYVDDMSTNPGENEFLLNRGSQVKIVAGPDKLTGAQQQGNHEVMYFDSELT